MLAATQPSGSFHVVASTADKSATGATVSHLTPSTSYQFEVRAVTAGARPAGEPARQQPKRAAHRGHDHLPAERDRRRRTVPGGRRSTDAFAHGARPRSWTRRSSRLTARSSNPGLVRNGALIFGGSGAERNVSITPTAGHSGLAMITVTADDGHKTSTGTAAVQVGTASADTLNGSGSSRRSARGRRQRHASRRWGHGHDAAAVPATTRLTGGPGADSIQRRYPAPTTRPTSRWTQGDTQDGIDPLNVVRGGR